MENKYKIFLLGGNSLIGNSILNGLKQRYENNETVLVVSTEKNFSADQIKVQNYRDYLDQIDRHLDPDSKNIFILSFGILNEESSANNLLDNLTEHININSYEKLFLFNKLKNIKNFHEIHIVSSILFWIF